MLLISWTDEYSGTMYIVSINDAMITSSIMPPAMPIIAETIEVATVHPARISRTWEENTAVKYSLS